MSLIQIRRNSSAQPVKKPLEVVSEKNSLQKSTVNADDNDDSQDEPMVICENTGNCFECLI